MLTSKRERRNASTHGTRGKPAGGPTLRVASGEAWAGPPASRGAPEAEEGEEGEPGRWGPAHGVHRMSSTSSTGAARAATWTDERTERLKALWADDALTASVIARRLGISRNAVLGKVHRLGLSNRRAPPSRASHAPRTRNSPRPVGAGRSARPGPGARPAPKPPAATASSPRPEIDRGLVARLEDLPWRACHWPIGDPLGEDFRFCGRPAGRAAYCEAHRRVAFRPGGPRPVGDLVRRLVDA